MRLIILLILLIGIIFAYYKKITNKRIFHTHKLTSDLIGDRLAYIFVENCKSPADIKKLKDGFSINATNEGMFLCLSSLYFVSFLLAVKSKHIKIPPSIIEEISQKFAYSLVSKYPIFHDMYKDANTLLQKQDEIIDRFVRVWDENLNSMPGPHWFVGKEVCYILNGLDKTPSPALIMVVAEFMANDAILIKNFLKELGEDFTITKNE